MPEEKRKAQFIYNKPEDYKNLYVNGVYGGVTPRGDISCNFFFEHSVIPSKEEYELTDDGKLGKKIEDAEDSIILTRDLKVGIVLRADAAESIANWLLDKVKALRGEKAE